MIERILIELLKDNDSIIIHRYNSNRYVYIVDKENNNTIFSVELVNNVLKLQSDNDFVYIFDISDPAFIDDFKKLFIL